MQYGIFFKGENMIKGLSNEEAKLKLKKDGKNILKEDKRMNLVFGIIAGCAFIFCICVIIRIISKVMQPTTMDVIPFLYYNS